MDRKMTKQQRIKELESQLMTIGFSGMAYSSVWQEKAKELNELKKELGLEVGKCGK